MAPITSAWDSVPRRWWGETGGWAPTAMLAPLANTAAWSTLLVIDVVVAQTVGVEL
jgi:hypothetical protein